MTFTDKPFTRDMNDGKHIFVFGSNLAGRHGAGAAKAAMRDWGAVHGLGIGLRGQSYAIPTKGHALNTLPIGAIALHVLNFLEFAKRHDEVTFLMTALGTGLAGYTHAQIAPMFKNAPDNCVLPGAWREFVV